MNLFDYETLIKLKKEKNLKIIDSHIHPFDVMGIYHYEDGRTDELTEIYPPGLSEKMNFGKIANFLSKKVFDFFDSIVIKEISSLYKNAGSKRLLDEMKKSLVDSITLLPIEPWVTTESVLKEFQNEKFYHLGSIDIHNIKIEDIESKISYFKQKGIVGLKLHPNLQDFKPQPSQNDKEMAKKLRKIYEVADKNNLYLLFHGGRSLYTKYINPKYKTFKRSSKNALIENFIDHNGKSELFENFKGKIIIAHLGHFGLNKLNEKALNLIISNYENVYFDTAATSSKLIAKFVDKNGVDRVILGSDGIYNRMHFSIHLIFRALKSVKQLNEENLIKILGENYLKILGKNG